MSEGITIEVNQAEVERQARALAALLIDDKKTKARIKKQIRKEITKARRLVLGDTRATIPNDPRSAYLAVRQVIWKKFMGGNINILPVRKGGAGTPRLIEPKRTLDKSKPGGNRLPRSRETERMMSYFGKDRAFILKWINQGTGERESRYGKRGSIRARQWFMASAGTALDIAADNLGKIIEEELSFMFNFEQDK